jgi:uncharacterized protein
MKKYVLYHAQCPDGFGAAYSAWKILKNEAEYIPVNHNNPIPPLENGSLLYIVDFCYPKNILLNLLSRMKQIIILDHHKTAQEDLQAIDLAQYPHLSVTFDMNKSGAVLTWEHFHQTPVPEFLRYIEDKDLWLFLLPQSKEFSAGLRGYDMDFELWDSLQVIDLIKEGDVLLKYQTKVVERLCGNARMIKIAGHEVPVVNSSILQSEIGNYLCKIYPDKAFGAVYFEVGEKRFLSLRSVGDFDVAKIASGYGGGGHKNASGFVIDIKQWEV